MKILCVEDDRSLFKGIKAFLEKWQYSVYGLEAFDDIDEAVQTISPHLVLLDINLPVRDGFYWCQKIRDVSKVPIIFISSRDSVMDQVMAMTLGGDDFIQKPFDLEMLLTKIRVLLRRTYDYNKTDELQVIQHEAFNFFIQSFEIEKDQKKVELTKNEARILQALMENKGKIVSRESLMRMLWKSEAFVDENTLTVNVSRLRKKLKDVTGTECIETKRGEGYILG